MLIGCRHSGVLREMCGLVLIEWCGCGVVYWLAQLASLTMVACLSVRWQGSRIQQYKLELDVWYVNHQRNAHTTISCLISVQKTTNYK